MKKESTKKRGALIACSTLMAVALMGGLALSVGGVTASAAEGDTGASTPRVFYYVDAGNLAANEDGSGQYGGREGGSVGHPKKEQTEFMKAYGLELGTGLYNSTLDNQYGADAVTGKSWGFTCDSSDYSWNQWRVNKTSASEKIDDGYNFSRHVNESNNHEGILTYKFQVDDATTDLKVTVGVRAYDGWGDSTYPYSVNGTSKEITATTNSNTKQETTTKGVEDGGNYYVTVDFGDATTTASAYVSWIMVATADYELPVTYTFPTFVKSNATEIALTPSVGSGDVTATLTEDSKTALADAEYLSEVNITATLEGGKTLTSKVTVIPATIKYFINVGSNHDVAGTVRDVQYSDENGCGYLEVQGTVGWEGDPYDTSNRYDVTDMTYRFDLAEGSYAAIVGTFTWWNNVRTATITANNGPEKTLTNSSSEQGTKDRETCYGDVTSASEGHLDVRFVCPEQAMLTYILVYEHTHGTMTSHEAVAATCEAAGHEAYYECEVCNQKYADEEATTPYVVRQKLEHNKTHHDAVSATCLAAGNVEYWSCSLCNKNYSDEACTQVLDTTVDPQKEHNKTHHDAVAATCLAAGNVEYWSCDLCNKNYSDANCTTELTDANKVIAQLAHNGVHHDAVSATCLAAGNVEYWSCDKGCNKNYSNANCTTELTDANRVTAQLAHNKTHHDAVSATCLVAGNVEYWSCSLCNKNYSDANCTTELTDANRVIAKLAHNGVHHDAVAATCTEAGAGEYWTCDKGCDKKYSDANCTQVITEVPVVAATGHAYDYAHLVWTWTDTTAAKAKATCSHDATHVEEATATITNKVTKEATKDEEGEITYTATVTMNGQTYTDTKTVKTDKIKGSGCGSSIGSTGVLIGLFACVGTAGVVLFLRKKKVNK